MSFLKQKTKEGWIEKGDHNSKLFHQSIKAKRYMNKTYAIQDTGGNWIHEEQQVKEDFVYYYEGLVGTRMGDRCNIKQHVVREGPLISGEQQRLLQCNFTTKDVKRVMFSIPNKKAPGCDGFNIFFFKQCWEIIHDEISATVLDFFQTCQLLKSLNNVTSITLIPKVKSPSHVGDFRLIACCSVIYKCITKLLCDKLKLVLPSIVSNTQGAFVERRSILYNILLCQDIVKMYKTWHTQKCCLMLIDI